MKWNSVKNANFWKNFEFLSKSVPVIDFSGILPKFGVKLGFGGVEVGSKWV